MIESYKKELLNYIVIHCNTSKHTQEKMLSLVREYSRMCNYDYNLNVSETYQSAINISPVTMAVLDLLRKSVNKYYRDKKRSHNRIICYTATTFLKIKPLTVACYLNIDTKKYRMFLTFFKKKELKTDYYDNFLKENGIIK